MKIFKIIILAIGVFFNTYVIAQNNNHVLKCEDFKLGTFEMFVDTFRIEIERKGGFQIEKSSVGITKYAIEWKSACEYNLEMLETTIKNSEQNIGRKYNVKIVDIKDNTYNYECEIVGFNYIIKGAISKVDK